MQGRSSLHRRLFIFGSGHACGAVQWLPVATRTGLAAAVCTEYDPCKVQTANTRNTTRQLDGPCQGVSAGVPEAVTVANSYRATSAAHGFDSHVIPRHFTSPPLVVVT
jgi:hypothetical protein